MCFPSRDLGETKNIERGEEVEPKTCFMFFDPARAPLAFNDNLVFAFKQLRCLLEGFLVQQFTGSVLVAQRQIPILGKFFC